MTYVVSLITLGDDGQKGTKTIVHHQDFSVESLLPSEELVATQLYQTVPEWIKLKKHLKTAEVFLNDKLYHIFHDNLSSESVLKYMQVLTNRFKPTNKFEEFLVEHGLLEKALAGVSIEFSSENNEYSKAFGPRTFRNQGSQVYKLHDEHRLSQYYNPHTRHVSGEGFRYTTTTKIVSIEKKPWVYEEPKPVVRVLGSTHAEQFLINEYQDYPDELI